MASRNVTVNVIGDSSSLERAFDRSSRASKQFGRNMDVAVTRSDRLNQSLRGGLSGFGSKSGFLFGSTAFISSAALTAALTKSVDVASNLNEQISKSRAVFGASSKVIEDWSKTTAQGIGVARDQAIEAAGSFGAMFRQAGQAGDDAANLSKSVVQLAGDLASFNNTSVDDALTALRSGLSGEIEPLRRYQVFLTEAAVQQKAMEQTGKDNAKQLTQGEKILARYSLIMEQTTRQQGDFQRTSSGLANQQRILAAQIRDTEGKLGQGLLPIVKQAVRQLNAAVTITTDFAGALRELANVRVPPIHIPLIFDQGDEGSTLGDIAGKALFTLGDFVDLTEKVVGNLVDDFKDETERATPQAARSLGVVLSDFVDNVLISASSQVKPSVDFNDLLGNVLATTAPSGEVAGKVTGALDRAIGIARGALDDAITKGRAAIAKDVRDKAREKQRNAFDDLIEAIGLGVRQAEVTPGIKDDLRRNTQLQNAIKAQIKVEGRTTELAGQLFDARQARAVILQGKAERAQEADRRASERLQAQQFRALGLSATGGEITPGVQNLRKQFTQLEGRLQGTGQELGSKLGNELKLAGKLLRDPAVKLTEQTRETIRDLFRTIRGTFNDESGKLGNLRHVQLSDKILTALGFGKDPDVKRLGNLTTGGRTFGTVSAADGGLNINGPITVVADNPDAFLRELQKKAGRTTATARGRFPGRSLGLG